MRTECWRSIDAVWTQWQSPSVGAQALAFVEVAPGMFICRWYFAGMEKTDTSGKTVHLRQSEKEGRVK